MVDIRIIMVVLFCAVLGAVGQIELKRGSDSLALNLGSLLSNYHLIVGILIYGVATVLYLLALSRGPVSVIYPVIATSYIWTCLFASYFLGENINFWNWLGVLLIIAGVYLVVK